MPELGHEVEDFAYYTWRLIKWKSLEKRITSPEFECGGHRWLVMLALHPPMSSFVDLTPTGAAQAHIVVPGRKLECTTK